MNFLIDLALILIIIISVAGGIRKGFIHSVMNVITFAASLICGWQFYPILGAYYKEKIFLDKIYSDVHVTVTQLVNSAIDTLFHDIPEILTDLTDRFGVDISALEEYYNSQKIYGANQLSANVSKFIAEPAAGAISDILAFLTIFLTAMILLKMVMLILDLIFKLPVLNAVNRLFGAMLGIFTGLLYAALFSAVLSVISPYLSAVLPQLYSPAMIESSVFVNIINKLNFFP